MLRVQALEQPERNGFEQFLIIHAFVQQNFSAHLSVLGHVLSTQEAAVSHARVSLQAAEFSRQATAGALCPGCLHGGAQEMQGKVGRTGLLQR